MPFGLNENIIEKVIYILSSFPQVDEAVIYGSRAKGNYKPNSDIDITLKGSDLSIAELNKISLMIDDLLYPNKFDLSIYSHINNPELLKHIERIGETFYKKNST
jgi:uncharacterized protein